MEFLIDGYIVHVDEEDAHLFVGRTWRAVEPTPGKIYIRWTTKKNGRGLVFYLHRMITNAPKGVMVDHHDGDSLNCRRKNLRLGDSLLNNRNMSKIRNRATTSRFKGVKWRPREKKWAVNIRHSGRQHHLGYFKNEAEAAFAYDHASMKFHGEQGRTNFLPFVR